MILDKVVILSLIYVRKPAVGPSTETLEFVKLT